MRVAEVLDEGAHTDSAGERGLEGVLEDVERLHLFLRENWRFVSFIL